MKNEKEHTNKKTLAELELELKRDAAADREIDDTAVYSQIKILMEKIEYIRQERYNVSSEYSQKKLAEKAGIGLSTYKDYLSGASDSIKLKTVINIADALGCKLSDLIDDSFTG